MGISSRKTTSRRRSANVGVLSTWAGLGAAVGVAVSAVGKAVGDGEGAADGRDVGVAVGTCEFGLRVIGAGENQNSG
jgi:hypothetical protein